MKTTTSSSTEAVANVAAWIGLDWADQQHVGCLYDVASGQQESFILEASAEAIPLWLAQLRQRYGGRRVAIVLEQRRGALIHALLGCDFVILYPILRLLSYHPVPARYYRTYGSYACLSPQAQEDYEYKEPLDHIQDRYGLI